jgi:hypothetical protein
MNAVVVYESHWGNTAEIARAVGAGIGPGTPVLTTDEATATALAGVDLLVVGAPVIAFRLATDGMRESLAASEQDAPRPPDLDHPSMRHWLDALPVASGHAAAFETRIHWSPGGATGAIERSLQMAGYRRIAKGRRFIVTGRYGPLREGELEAARAWGADLAHALEPKAVAVEA